MKGLHQKFRPKLTNRVPNNFRFALIYSKLGEWRDDAGWIRVSLYSCLLQLYVIVTILCFNEDLTMLKFVYIFCYLINNT